MAFKKMMFLILFCSQLNLNASTASEIKIINGFDGYYELADFAGKTYLDFVKTELKPELDKVATDGYVLAGGAEVKNVYLNFIDKSVQRKVLRSGKSLENIVNIADQLEGETVTLDTLPELVAETDRGVERYGLSTFFGLASGGGVAIKFFENNYAYNVHYDVKEQKSGRSFSVGPTRSAKDSSDAAYLDDLENYIRGEQSKENIPIFYKTLLEVLLDSNTQNYDKIIPSGQTVLTDFLAVYTAEQVRNLMDNRINLHWDAALLEVTLLSSFHAGQKRIKLYYYNPGTKETEFTGKTLRQTRCKIPDQEKTKRAQLRDYWQFSRRIDDPRNCRRSGINITKREFRRLEKEISKYICQFRKPICEAVKSSLGVTGRVKNIYMELSKFLINSETPVLLGPDSAKIAKAYLDFLVQVTKDANKITLGLE